MQLVLIIICSNGKIVMQYSTERGEKMANIKSAKKRILVLEKKTRKNKRIKNNLKAILKNFESALTSGDFDVAKEKLVLAEKKLKKAASKSVIHKNTASRKVSRLARKFNKAIKAA